MKCEYEWRNDPPPCPTYEPEGLGSNGCYYETGGECTFSKSPKGEIAALRAQLASEKKSKEAWESLAQNKDTEAETLRSRLSCADADLVDLRTSLALTARQLELTTAKGSAAETALAAAQAENDQWRGWILPALGMTEHFGWKDALRGIDDLKAECFELAAGCCEHLLGDAHGNPTCKYRESLRARPDAVQTVALPFGESAEMPLRARPDDGRVERTCRDCTHWRGESMWSGSPCGAKETAGLGYGCNKYQAKPRATSDGGKGGA